MFENVFDDWPGEICGYRTLHLVDRPVRIDTTKAFPGLGMAPRRDELPMWVKAGGYLITGPWMPGRQIAWIRRANDGDWTAVCLLQVRSGNGQSQATMQLWLEPDAIAPLG
ncbi:hypothetical protein KL953_30185 [Mycolicibacterium goodii]|jgi:hypothetical protein|nr:hypothetical protein [Mycolicibacterium goodii]